MFIIISRLSLLCSVYSADIYGARSGDRAYAKFVNIMKFSLCSLLLLCALCGKSFLMNDSDSTTGNVPTERPFCHSNSNILNQFDFYSPARYIEYRIVPVLFRLFSPLGVTPSASEIIPCEPDLDHASVGKRL